MIKERLISALIGTLFITVFQPFGLSHMGWQKWPLLAGILLLTCLSCVLSEYAVRYIARMPLKKEIDPAYTIRRGLLFQLFNIILMPVFICLFMDSFGNTDVVDNHLSVGNYLWCLSVCLCASFIIGLYWRNVYWKRHFAHQLEEAQLLNGVLMERSRQQQQARQQQMTLHQQLPQNASPLVGEQTPMQTPQKTEQEAQMVNSAETSDAASTILPTANAEQVIRLEGDTKDMLAIRACDFIYAESEGNYANIIYMEGETVKKMMLRISIKSIVQTFLPFNSIMQCHRAYIVNLSFVAKVEGRSSGIGLLMQYTDFSVPVSKSYAAEVKERIKNPL